MRRNRGVLLTELEEGWQTNGIWLWRQGNTLLLLNVAWDYYIIIELTSIVFFGARKMVLKISSKFNVDKGKDRLKVIWFLH